MLGYCYSKLYWRYMVSFIIAKLTYKKKCPLSRVVSTKNMQDFLDNFAVNKLVNESQSQGFRCIKL